MLPNGNSPVVLGLMVSILYPAIDYDIIERELIQKGNLPDLINWLIRGGFHNEVLRGHVENSRDSRHNSLTPTSSSLFIKIYVEIVTQT